MQSLSRGNVPMIVAALDRLLLVGNPDPETLARTACTAAYWLLAALICVLRDLLADKFLIQFLFRQVGLLVTGRGPPSGPPTPWSRKYCSHSVLAQILLFFLSHPECLIPFTICLHRQPLGLVMNEIFP